MARVEVYKVHRPKLFPNVAKPDIYQVVCIKGVYFNYFKFMNEIHLWVVACIF
jgi:hypothetical protein